MENLNNRTKKFTMVEFNALDRNDEGRVVSDFDLAWVWMTNNQKAMLHGDDQSRGFDVDEEIHHMMHAEFG